MTSATVMIPEAEDRRVWKALTRCAAPAGKAARPILEHVLFDGERAWATDSYVLGHLHAPVELPLRDGPEGPDRYPVIVSAELLRGALGLVKGDTITRLRLDRQCATLVVGEDALPLGDDFDTPTVTIPYADNVEVYPTSSTLHTIGFPDEGPSDEEPTRSIGVNAKHLGRVGDLVWGGDPIVTVHRHGGTLLVRNANNGRPVGSIARLHAWDEQLSITRPGAPAEEDES